MTADRKGRPMQTHSGRQFWPLNPQQSEVDILDIAHALANICRFGGHVRSFYSVAQHSVLVSRIVPPEHALAGLLHDAAEAYVGDMIRPIKTMCGMEAYRLAEMMVLDAICERFWLPGFPDCVHEADAVALATEARDLMGVDPGSWDLPAPLPERIAPVDPLRAKDEFLRRFAELSPEHR